MYSYTEPTHERCWVTLKVLWCGWTLITGHEESAVLARDLWKADTLRLHLLKQTPTNWAHPLTGLFFWPTWMTRGGGGWLMLQSESFLEKVERPHCQKSFHAQHFLLLLMVNCSFIISISFNFKSTSTENQWAFIVKQQDMEPRQCLYHLNGQCTGLSCWTWAWISFFHFGWICQLN